MGKREDRREEKREIRISIDKLDKEDRQGKVQRENPITE